MGEEPHLSNAMTVVQQAETGAHHLAKWSRGFVAQAAQAQEQINAKQSVVTVGSSQKKNAKTATPKMEMDAVHPAKLNLDLPATVVDTTARIVVTRSPAQMVSAMLGKNAMIRTKTTETDVLLLVKLKWDGIVHTQNQDKKTPAGQYAATRSELALKSAIHHRSIVINSAS